MDSDLRPCLPQNGILFSQPKSLLKDLNISELTKRLILCKPKILPVQAPKQSSPDNTEKVEEAILNLKSIL
ncbi:hypothetical protein HK096_001053, partial [Nowakowskiella sp. JEL0078]